jgi:hypothetical protein
LIKTSATSWEFQICGGNLPTKRAKEREFPLPKEANFYGFTQRIVTSLAIALPACVPRKINKAKPVVFLAILLKINDLKMFENRLNDFARAGSNYSLGYVRLWVG